MWGYQMQVRKQGEKKGLSDDYPENVKRLQEKERGGVEGKEEREKKKSSFHAKAAAKGMGWNTSRRRRLNFDQCPQFIKGK